MMNTTATYTDSSTGRETALEYWQQSHPNTDNFTVGYPYSWPSYHHCTSKSLTDYSLAQLADELQRRLGADKEAKAALAKLAKTLKDLT